MSALKPIKTRPLHDGTQALALYRFENGYGASVVQQYGSYGGGEGLGELAVVTWDGDDYAPTYDTPITDDVLGWLGEGDVADTLQRIAALPSRDEGGPR